MQSFDHLGVRLSQQGPAETGEFMLLGYAVILGVMAMYIVNLYLRFRNLGRDRAALDEVLGDEQD